MGIFNRLTLLAEVLDHAADLDRLEGRNPQQRDGTLALACEVYSTAHYQHDVPEDTAAALAALATGVNPWSGYWDAEGRWVD